MDENENKYVNYKVLKYVLSKVKNWVDQILGAVKDISIETQNIANGVKQTIMQTIVSSRTVEVAASEFAAYISSLPRLLTEDLTITVGDGIIPNLIIITGLYGPGKLKIQAEESATVVFSTGLIIENCAVRIDLRALTIKTSNDQISYTSFGVQNSYVKMENCLIDRPTDIWVAGMTIMNGARVFMSSCNFTNCKNAIACYDASVVSINNCSGSGNTNGIMTVNGGIALLVGTTQSTLGGVLNYRSGGGLIVKNDGTLL